MLALCASKESGLKIFDTRDRDNDEEKRNEFGGVVPHWRRERCTYSTKNRNDELVPSISCAFSGNGGKVLGGRRERERSVRLGYEQTGTRMSKSWFQDSIEVDELLCHGERI